MNLILVGPPGAGKGTQAEKLTAHFKIPHLSTGNIFRAAIAAGTDLGKQVEPIMKSGGLVPDAMVVPLVNARLKATDVAVGCLFDGYPRTIPQAEALEVAFRELKRQIDRVVLIDVPDAAIVERMSGRRSCPKDNTVYHLVASPPKKAGVCDKCGTPLIVRDDDKPETVQKRLTKFANDTAPLLKFYEPKGLLARVNGTGTPDQVFAAILKQLGG